MIDVACPVCGGNGSEAWGDAWKRCGSRTCGHIFRRPQPSKEELAHHYEAIYYPSPVAQKHGVLENTSVGIARQVLSWLGSMENRSLLDVGCGKATFWEVLPPSAQAKYVGIELDPVGAAEARMTTGRPIYDSLESLESAGTPTEFDLILMNQVIEHVREPVATLETLRRIAGSQTLLLVATPNASCLSALLRQDRWGQARNPTHLHLFTRSSLSRALIRAGWASTSVIKKPIRYWEGQAVRNLVVRGLRFAGRDGNLTLLARAGA